MDSNKRIIDLVSKSDIDAVEEWLRDRHNVECAEIDPDGSVYVGSNNGIGGMDGRWLSNEEIDADVDQMIREQNRVD